MIFKRFAANLRAQNWFGSNTARELDCFVKSFLAMMERMSPA